MFCNTFFWLRLRPLLYQTKWIYNYISNLEIRLSQSLIHDQHTKTEKKNNTQIIARSLISNLLSYFNKITHTHTLSRSPTFLYMQIPCNSHRHISHSFGNGHNRKRKKNQTNTQFDDHSIKHLLRGLSFRRDFVNFPRASPQQNRYRVSQHSMYEWSHIKFLAKHKYNIASYPIRAENSAHRVRGCRNYVCGDREHSAINHH